MTTQYDIYPAVMRALDLLGIGHTLTAACDEANINLSTFKKYVQSTPELRELYDDALQRGYDAMADALINIDNHRIHGQSDPKMAAVVSKNIMWYLSKKRPKDFGDKIEVNHTVTLDKTIVQALAAAKNRTAALAPPTVEDVAFTVVQDEEDTAWMTL